MSAEKARAEASYPGIGPQDGAYQTPHAPQRGMQPMSGRAYGFEYPCPPEYRGQDGAAQGFPPPPDYLPYEEAPWGYQPPVEYGNDDYQYDDYQYDDYQYDEYYYEEYPQQQPGQAQYYREQERYYRQEPPAYDKPRPIPPRARRPKKPRNPAAERLKLAVCVPLAAICLFLGGRLVLSMLKNDSEVERHRSEFISQNGVTIERGSTRVELLPPGQTYVPTATPYVPPKPTPEPRIDMGRDAITDMNEKARSENAKKDEAASTRTRSRQYPDNPMLLIREDFAALRRINPDIVARLTIDGVLDEIITQRDNLYYLTHDTDGRYDIDGAVYLDMNCSLRRPPENMLLRGKCLDGKRFGPLLRYRDEGVQLLRSSGVFRLDTLFEEGLYAVFSVFSAQTDPSGPGYFNFSGYQTFESDRQADNYIAAAREISMFDIPIDVNAQDRLVTLATIGGLSDGSCFVIIARMARQGETPAQLSAMLKGAAAK